MCLKEIKANTAPQNYVISTIILTRKIKADDIFTGTAFTGVGQVLITDETGIVKAIVPEQEAGENVETVEGILCPGFINAHCHIELSHLKDKIPQRTGLVDFVQTVMTQRGATAEEKADAMQNAELELYSSGTVAVGDICNTADSVELKKSSKIYWHNFIEISGFVEAGAQKRFDDANQILDIFNSLLITHQSSLSPHAPYSVSQKLFSLINAATSGELISIHNQESKAENELYENKSGDFLRLYKNFGIDISSFAASGKSSLQTWLPYFTNHQRVISVHDTFTTEADLRHLSFITHHPSLFFSLCANANLYIENALPPIEMLIKNNCNIIIGTDSYASNTQLNIFEEIKTLRKHFPQIALETILKWATLNGATALGIESKFGSFDKGKQPGVVLINNDAASRFL